MNDSSFPVPPVLKGYRDLSFTGQGTVGAVFRAESVSLRRPVALKILHPHWNAHPEVKARFQQEALILSRLDHPGVVKVHEVGEENGFFFIAMEWLSGEDLGSFLKREQKVPWEKAAGWIREAALSLHAAHAKKILHRDLKPENLFLVSPGEAVKLVDFGLAKLLEEATTLSLQGNFVGTPRYLSPEQIKGLPLDERSDLYSLGVVFFELLAGHPPFRADSVSAMIYQQLHESPAPLVELIPGLPAALRSLLLALLSKDPEARPQNAAVLAKALDSLLRNPALPTLEIPAFKKNRFRLSFFAALALIVFFLAFHILSPSPISSPARLSFFKTEKGWKLLKDGKPFEIRGLRYSPFSLDSLSGALLWDRNHNQIPDALESFLDNNQNGKQDKDEPGEGDFRLMQKMGFNTLAVEVPLCEKKNIQAFSEFHSRLRSLLREAFKQCGILVMLEHPCPGKTLSPDALSAWKESLQKTLSEHSMEPYLLGWVLDAGETFPMPSASPLSDTFEIFLRQALSLAVCVKEADPVHPLILGNLSLETLPLLKNALRLNPALDIPAVDMLGLCAFVSPQKFSALKPSMELFPGKPLLLTAFGCPAFNGILKKEDGESQARFLEDCFSGLGQKFPGFFLWEWMDRWERDGTPETQDVAGKTWLVFPDGSSHAEWMGLVAGDPRNILARRPRTFALRRLHARGS